MLNNYYLRIKIKVYFFLIIIFLNSSTTNSGTSRTSNSNNAKMNTIASIHSGSGSAAVTSAGGNKHDLEVCLHFINSLFTFVSSKFVYIFWTICLHLFHQNLFTFSELFVYRLICIQDIILRPRPSCHKFLIQFLKKRRKRLLNSTVY